MLTNPPPGLSVVLSGVNTQRSDSAGWELAMEAVNSSVSFKPGTAGSVPFKLSWSKTKPVSGLLIVAAGCGWMRWRRIKHRVLHL